MLKAVVEDPGAFYQHYPRAVAVVTVNSEGRKNAMAVAWHSPVSYRPPLYGVALSPKRYSYNMILQSRCFGINFLPYEKIDLIAAVGGSSGSFTDKFTEFDMAEDSPLKTDVPILRDAYAAYECVVTENRLYGDHAWIIGEIKATHVAGELLKDNGILDMEMVKPALYLGGDTYCHVEKSSVKHIARDKSGKG